MYNRFDGLYVGREEDGALSMQARSTDDRLSHPAVSATAAAYGFPRVSLQRTADAFAR
jgi:hypothetical protein